MSVTVSPVMVSSVLSTASAPPSTDIMPRERGGRGRKTRVVERKREREREMSKKEGSGRGRKREGGRRESVCV